MPLNELLVGGVVTVVFVTLIAVAWRIRHRQHASNSRMTSDHVRINLAPGIIERQDSEHNQGPRFSLISTVRTDAYRTEWSTDGHLLASCHGDGLVRVWDARQSEVKVTLQGHTESTHGLAWSPSGDRIATASWDETVRIWNAQTGENVHIILGNGTRFEDVAWSPNGETIASACWDRLVHLWRAEDGTSQRILKGHSDIVRCVAWSPDGARLASGSRDSSIRVWDVQSGKSILRLRGHARSVERILWSPDSKFLASASWDGTVRIWASPTGKLLRTLEGHAGPVTALSISFDGRILVSMSRQQGASLICWRTDTWERVATLPVFPWDEAHSLAFCPGKPKLVANGDSERELRTWLLDIEALATEGTGQSMQYSNAKVALLGESGVGKSGLSMALQGKPFEPTFSTHGRHVFVFDVQEVKLDRRRSELRETLLWDLAGQPGYHLIHQLFLDEVVVALVVIDGSRTDPFKDVYFWDRALRQSQVVQGAAAPPLQKLLVVARTDAGGTGVGRERIERIQKELGFAGYYLTSSKEGWGIEELAISIRQAIDWEKVPKISSTALFQTIKEFLRTEGEKPGAVLATADDLYKKFMKDVVKKGKVTEDLRAQLQMMEDVDLRAQFEVCVGLAESRGLVKRLSWINQILLKPQVLDAYASALVNAVADDDASNGSILESRVKNCEFQMPEDARLKNKGQEQLLLLAMIEDLVQRELVLRQDTNDGVVLFFPSQVRREVPESEEDEIKKRTTVIFEFEGSIWQIYAMLAVRLAHSGFFKLKGGWVGTSTYMSSSGGICGLSVRDLDQGRGELRLFAMGASEEVQFQFEEFIYTHLQKNTAQDKIVRYRVFRCPKDAIPLSREAVDARLKSGFDWTMCPACLNTRIMLIDGEARFKVPPTSLAAAMEREADSSRERQAQQVVVEGILALKRSTGSYDVFLCHNSQDHSAVKRIAEGLLERGILPWLDEWNLPPGVDIIRGLEAGMEKSKAAAVFVGESGMGPWHREEMAVLLSESVSIGKKVIPVLLPGCEEVPAIPAFLRIRKWVDFRIDSPDPLEELIWGITGIRTGGEDEAEVKSSEAS